MPLITKDGVVWLLGVQDLGVEVELLQGGTSISLLMVAELHLT